MMAESYLLLEEILSKDSGINGKLLSDADQIRILNVIPCRNLHVAHTETLTDAAEDISGATV